MPRKSTPGHLGTQLSGGSFGVSTLHLIQEYQQGEFLSTFQKEAERRLGHSIDSYWLRHWRNL
ncbi:MAG: hypothetical protein O3B89_03470 [Verrucomicrobia bacterium]|nr:hypothetical protein [Verrucomicrobiota bacterium]